MHSDMVVTLRTTTIGSGADAGTPGLDRVFTAFGERITGPIDRNGYAGAWGYQSHDVSGGSGGGSGSAVPFDFLHVGARYYDPSSGGFLQRDPIGVRGGRNVYEYALSRPTVFLDSSGFKACPTCGHDPDDDTSISIGPISVPLCGLVRKLKRAARKAQDWWYNGPVYDYIFDPIDDFFDYLGNDPLFPPPWDRDKKPAPPKKKPPKAPPYSPPVFTCHPAKGHKGLFRTSYSWVFSTTCV
jgi:RHS repeat-associated protein